MNAEFLSLTKTLKVALLSADDIAALNRLQEQWERWEARERQHAPTRVAEEQRAAFDAFLDNPCNETEQKVLITADEALTGKRYAALRRACTALRGRISAQAAEIIRPVLDRALDSLNVEHSRRRERAEAVMGSRDRNPVVVEVQRAIDFAEKLAHRAYMALSGTEDVSPLTLADVLMREPSALTPEERS